MSDKKVTSNPTELSIEEKKILEKFVDDNQLFYGPDPQIVRNHKLMPRTEEETRALEAGIDAQRINLVRGRLESALEEGFNMVEKMGVAPGAKWGDLVTAVFTSSGDMAQIAPSGIGVFASVCQYPIKFINKYWTNESTVGIKDGDGFIHNDSRYGGVHNTDQSMIVPVFYSGKLICWIATIIHEGENGSIEPGGLPSIAESPFDEGLKMSPFRCAENFELKRDLVNFLQNSVRDPKLQYADMKVKLHASLRLRERILAVVEEFGEEALIGSLRKTLEDTETEVRRRIKELPDGTVRINTWLDHSLREPLLAKVPMAVTIDDDRMVFDFRGACPELANRSINTHISAFKTCLATNMILYVWPDLPVNQAIFSPIEMRTNRNSLVDPSNDSPNAMSLLPLFRAMSIPASLFAKLYFCLPKRYTALSASHYNQPATFIYGGITQHGEVTGNFCADINGNGTGAREDNDGENAMSPLFGAVADTGEQELAEEELPYVRLVGQQLAKDRIGFGKYRGGLGYEQMVTVRSSSFWGFMTGQCGSKHPSVYGVFGGYGCPAYPLAKVKGINIFEEIKENPNALKLDIVEMMNAQEIPEADYVVQEAAMSFEPCAEGEIYMICQGAGGGYGDVLERDPFQVLKDVEENILSTALAEEIYKVIIDPETLILDETASISARCEEREKRKVRGRPYKEFCKDWVQPGPPEDLPYMGSWGDAGEEIIASPPGESRYVMKGDEMAGVMLSNPKDRRIRDLENEIRQLRNKN